MRKFWEDEEIQQPLPLKVEEQQCEQHFITTHTRMPNSRYMVRLQLQNRQPTSYRRFTTHSHRVICSPGKKIVFSTGDS